MPTLYVVTLRTGRGGGPAIGFPREDIAVEVPDKTEASFEAARETAAAEWAAKHGLPIKQCLIVGVY